MVLGFLPFLLSYLVLVSGSSINLPTFPFDEGYTPLFGDGNLMALRDGKSVHLSLDERSGSGFISHDLYLHGFFSASIKLPTDYTAGVVVTFYMSNGDMLEKNHAELDFEFLGNIRGKNWRIQTNVYGNGSTNTGREERYGLWFDPTEDFHQYSILWTDNKIIFYIDNVPIREVKKTESMGGDYPAKPMALDATVWDGSDWATNGGRYRVNYKYAPYIAEFSDLVLHGCTVDPLELSSKCENSPNSESIPKGSKESRWRILGRITLHIHIVMTRPVTWCLHLSAYSILKNVLVCRFLIRLPSGEAATATMGNNIIQAGARQVIFDSYLFVGALWSFYSTFESFGVIFCVHKGHYSGNIFVEGGKGVNSGHTI